MHFFSPANECNTILPIHHLSHYYYEWFECDYNNHNINHFIYIIHIILHNEFESYDFEKEFSKNFQYVHFEIDNNFLGYNLKLLKLSLSNDSENSINNMKKQNFVNFHLFRQEQDKLHSDLKFIYQYLRNQTLLENF